MLVVIHGAGEIVDAGEPVLGAVRVHAAGEELHVRRVRGIVRHGVHVALETSVHQKQSHEWGGEKFQQHYQAEHEKKVGRKKISIFLGLKIFLLYQAGMIFARDEGCAGCLAEEDRTSGLCRLAEAVRFCKILQCKYRFSRAGLWYPRQTHTSRIMNHPSTVLHISTFSSEGSSLTPPTRIFYKIADHPHSLPRLFPEIWPRSIGNPTFQPNPRQSIRNILQK